MVAVSDDDASMRAAAARALQKEHDWSHPRRLDLDDGTLQACEDRRCRYCRDTAGEVRNGFVV